ncbi:MAG: STAS domain-containing protein [Candidatus Sericytochromatia bacterium]|nr:STAS domain-containing protein [Candidatus Tanganyikabacteria bacterium]
MGDIQETGISKRDVEISEEEISRRKAFLEFTEDDVRRLESINEFAEKYAEPVIEEFYRHILRFEESREFFRDPLVLERVKRAQKAYFLRLTQGDYGRAYVEDRLRIGIVHERIGLPMKLYLGMYSWYLRAVGARILEAFPNDYRRAFDTYISLKKLVWFDIGLAIDTYIIQRESTIRMQQEAIRELSTPVLQVREGLLILPIVGLIDSSRARQLPEQLLRAIRQSRARVVVMDITGVPGVDSRVANHLVQTVEASRLMGAAVIVTGLSPEVAQALVALGVDLSKMRTVGDLQGGMELAERLLGYRVTREERDPEGG